MCQWMRVFWPWALKKRGNHVQCHIADVGGVPARVMVFVNRQGAYAFHCFAGIAKAAQMRGVEAMAHHAALHLQVLR